MKMERDGRTWIDAAEVMMRHPFTMQDLLRLEAQGRLTRITECDAYIFYPLDQIESLSRRDHAEVRETAIAAIGISPVPFDRFK